MRKIEIDAMASVLFDCATFFTLLHAFCLNILKLTFTFDGVC